MMNTPALFESLSTIEDYCFATGLLINSFLLFCIVFRTKCDLGVYKYMQVIFVSMDLVYALAQMVIRERIIVHECALVVIGLSPIANDKLVIIGFLALWAVTYLMIDYNFLYRLWAIQSPDRLRLFSKPWFILILVLFFVCFYLLWVTTIYWFFDTTDRGRQRLREMVMQKYGVDTLTQGMVMADYFHADGSRDVRQTIGVLIESVMFGVCGSFMIYASANIVHYLKNAKLISEKALQLQRQLFVLLCAQTLIPLTLLYAPCLFNMGLPFVGVDIGTSADLTPICLSLFLPVDGLAILYLMKDYRRAVIRLVTCGRWPARQRIDVVSSHANSC